MELLLGAGIIAFVIVACLLIRFINRSTLKNIVFKDRSVVKAGCVGDELCEKYSEYLSGNDISCVPFENCDNAGEYTHIIFLFNDDSKNIEAIKKCLEINPGAVMYSVMNDDSFRSEYAAHGALLIENKNDVSSVMYNIIAGLEDVSE